MRLLISLLMLAFAQLLFNVAHASPHKPVNVTQQKHKAERIVAREDDRRKRRPVKNHSGKKVKEPLNKKSRLNVKNTRPAAVKKNTLKKSTDLVADKNQKNSARLAKEKVRYGRRSAEKRRLARTEHESSIPLKLTKIHRARYQEARETVMNKLMGQLGKPYQWGGSSPKTGFDCSGLVWYAYKDLVKIKIPRTANEMYHLRDAAPVRRDRLEKGDLVFFRINRRGAADHVGVYVGDGKFIQSPRTGKDIQVTALNEEYWQHHYIGARRVMTPGTIR